jgi:hypothetical protein
MRVDKSRKKDYVGIRKKYIRKKITQKGKGFGDAFSVGLKRTFKLPTSSTIRTGTGQYKTFGFFQKGYFVKLPFVKRSTKNIRARLGYINTTIGGKMSKVNKYHIDLNLAKIKVQNKIDLLTKKAARLKDTNPVKYKKIMNKITSKKLKFDKYANGIDKQIKDARKELKEVSKKYEGETIKLQNLMDKKMYKSQKRLTKGLSKGCNNMKIGQQLGCSEAIGICKNHGINVNEYLKCMNSYGFNIPENDLYKHMESSAKSHFIRRFKRGRQLREIKRLRTQGAELEQIKGETVERIKDSEKMIKDPTTPESIIRRHSEEVGQHIKNAEYTLDKLGKNAEYTLDKLGKKELTVNEILSAPSAARAGIESEA